MGLSCGMEIRIDAQMEPKSAAPEPRTSAAGEIRGLHFLGQPEYARIERARRRLLPRRHRKLDVIEIDDFIHNAMRWIQGDFRIWP
jgi:hypothetical protein